MTSALGRFKTLPSMAKLTSLRIRGDVSFGKDVQLIGNVNIEVKEGSKHFIENKTTLQDQNVVIE